MHTSLSRALVPTRVCTRSRSLLLVRSHSLSFSLVSSLARFSLANALTRVLVPVLSLSLTLVHASLSLVSFSRSFAPTRVRARDPLVLVLSCLSDCPPQLPTSVAFISSLTHFSDPLLHLCTKRAHYTQFTIKKFSS